MAVAHAARGPAREQVARHRGGQKAQRGVEHGHVHLLALPGGAGLQQRGQRGPGGEQAGHHVADGLAHDGGRAIGLARGLHEAAHGLHDDVVGRPVGQRPGLAEARDADIDQARIECPQLACADAQALGHAGAEVLHHHVGLGGHLADQGHGLGVLEVQHQALLVAVHHREQRAFAVVHGADGAVVVALRRLDLDDLGAQVGQQGRGQRPGQHAREVEDAHAVQRAGGTGRGGGRGGFGH